MITRFLKPSLRENKQKIKKAKGNLVKQKIIKPVRERLFFLFLSCFLFLLPQWNSFKHIREQKSLNLIRFYQDYFNKKEPILPVVGEITAYNSIELYEVF